MGLSNLIKPCIANGSLLARAHNLALAFTRDEKGKVLRHSTFGIWPVSLADNLENALLKGLRKIVLWVDQNDGRGVEFDQCLFDPFFNVNSPDDLAKAERLIGMTK